MQLSNYIHKPHRFLKLVRFCAFIAFFVFSFLGNSQNVLIKEIRAENITTISVHGNQIFKISVSTSKTEIIKIKSSLDGEYQNKFQVFSKIQNDSLVIDLEPFLFSKIADDKLNAHKTVAVTLELEIPEHLNLRIFSDVGSVNLKGDFNLIFVELSRGHCHIAGSANKAIINTIDGSIHIETIYANVTARSNNGTVLVEKFKHLENLWSLKSINGNITVIKQY